MNNTQNNLYQFDKMDRMNSPNTNTNSTLPSNTDNSTTSTSTSTVNKSSVSASKLSATMSFDEFAASRCANSTIPPPIPMQWQLTIDEDQIEMVLDDEYHMVDDHDLDDLVEVTEVESYELDEDEDDVDISRMLSSIPSMSLLHNSNSSTSTVSITSTISSISNVSFEPDEFDDVDDDAETEHDIEEIANPAHTDYVQTPPRWIDTSAFQNRQSCHVQVSVSSKPTPSVVDDDTTNNNNNEEAMETAGECEQYEPLECDAIVRCLRQFGHSNTDAYQQQYSVLMHGYIRRIQASVKQIIPAEIAEICCEFYYEQEKKHIGLAFNLYQHFVQSERGSIAPPSLFSMNRTNATFSGHELKQMMAQQHDDNDEDDDEERTVSSQHDMQDAHTLEILRECLQFQIVDLVSYRTSFSSLFHRVKTEPQHFVPSQHYIYCFNPQFQAAFDEYKQSQRQ